MREVLNHPRICQATRQRQYQRQPLFSHSSCPSQPVFPSPSITCRCFCFLRTYIAPCLSLSLGQASTNSRSAVRTFLSPLKFAVWYTFTPTPGTPIHDHSDPLALSSSKKPKDSALADALFNRPVNIQLACRDTGSGKTLAQPNVVRGVSTRTREYFKKSYGEPSDLACARLVDSFPSIVLRLHTLRFEYDPIRQNVIVLLLPSTTKHQPSWWTRSRCEC